MIMNTQELQDLVARLTQGSRLLTDLLALAQWAITDQHALQELHEQRVACEAQLATLEDAKKDLQREVRQLQADIERLSVHRQEVFAAHQAELASRSAAHQAALDAMEAERHAKERAVEQAMQVSAARLQAMQEAEQAQEAALERARAAFRDIAAGVGAT